MSLFNNASSQTLSGAVSGVIGKAGGMLGSALGGGKLGNAIAGAASKAASKAAQRAVGRLSRNAQVGLAAGLGAIGDIQRGDFAGAAVRAMDSGLIQNFLDKKLGGLDKQKGYWSTPIPLLGGFSPKEAADLIKRHIDTKKAKQSLFMIEVSSDVDGDYSELFNFFAVSCEYASFSLSGTPKRVGGHIYNIPNATEPTELNITALDDDMGTIKHWFADHATTAARKDGTFGLPAEYAIRIKIVHGFATKPVGAYEDKGVFFAATMQTSQSRSEHGYTEVQMTFHQIDSMMS